MKLARGLWTIKETSTLLTIMKEKNVMKFFVDNKRNREIYTMLKSEMEKRGCLEKDEQQIAVKWKNLKHHYRTSCSTRNTKRKYPKFHFYDDMYELIGSPQCTASASSSALDKTSNNNRRKNEKTPDCENCRDSSAEKPRTRRERQTMKGRHSNKGFNARRKKSSIPANNSFWLKMERLSKKNLENFYKKTVKLLADQNILRKVEMDEMTKMITLRLSNIQKKLQNSSNLNKKAQTQNKATQTDMIDMMKLLHDEVTHPDSPTKTTNNTDAKTNTTSSLKEEDIDNEDMMIIYQELSNDEYE